MELGERYYRFFKKTVCKECAFSPVGGKCILCRKPATDVLKYKDVVLCRSCSRTATGYVGYI